MVSGTLSQLHPLPCKRDTVVTGAVLGAIISLFLIIFEPFGINNVPDSATLNMVLAGYGVVTFLIVAFTGVLLPMLFPRFYHPARWTLLKDLFFYGLLNFLLVSIANVFYSAWAFDYALSWGRFVFAVFSTFSVGFLPFVILLLVRHNRLLRHNLKMAGDLNSQLHPAGVRADVTTVQPVRSDMVTIRSDNGYDTVSFCPADLLYAESADNYVRLVLLEQGAVRMAMVRQTMKVAEEHLSECPQIVRCHRSYMVNLERVTSFTGNAQGLKLSFADTDVQVPVSRSAVNGIKALLSAT